MNDELVLNLGEEAGAFVDKSTQVTRMTDPVLPGASTPGDFAAQFPTPLQTEELIAMCEEVSLYNYIPERFFKLKAETYREMNELAFTSGSSYLTFADGACPEAYEHDGDNTTVTLKNLGAYKALTISDILHSSAVASAGWNGINELIGAFPSGEGMPGGGQLGTFQRQKIADLKEKEMRLAATLVLNGWDELLVDGDSSANALEFDGIETRVTAANGAHTSTLSASGSFSASAFDRFLSESCAKPQVIMGHSQVIQEFMSAYFQLGYQGSQIVNFDTGDRIVPGFNYASEVNTGAGRMQVVADDNFTITAAGSNTIQSDIFALRMTHNGYPLIYKRTQIPLSFKDLAPGCTAIAFQIWVKTALIIKALCAQGRYTSLFTGRSTSTCPRVSLTND